MRVGVIVPVRAPAPYLAEALEAVLSQEPAPDSVVVVADGSQPPSRVPDEVQMVRLDDGPRGPAAARAAGLAVLDADLIALADADDVWQRGKLAAQVEALTAHAEAAVCFGRAVVVGADGRETGERLPEIAGGVHSAESLRELLYERNVVPAASAVVRRDVLEAVGGFEGLAVPAGSDWELWLRIVAAGHPFLCEPRAVVRYRRHTAGLTSDVARLGESGLLIHAAHAGLVDAGVAREARARDYETLARGRVRARRYGEARAALADAAALRPLAARERLLRAALAVPGLRGGLGRRDPYA